MTVQGILSWLQALPEACEDFPASPSQVKKRKASQQPTPPATSYDMDLTPTRKRQRGLALETDDIQLTPRAHGTSRSSPVASSTSTSHSSLRSRSTSPLKKQFLELRLDSAGLELRELDVDVNPNPQSAELLDILYDIGGRLRLLPDDQREVIFNSAVSHGINPRRWQYSFKAPDEVDTLPGRIPSPEEVALIRELARECSAIKYEEAGWNVEVHHRLLEAVFRKPGSAKGDTFNVIMSTTARPHANWLPRSVGSKMVDLCIYADIGGEPKMAQSQMALCRRTPTRSVNHTDFLPLQHRPIVLSIETKRAGKDMEAAELQIGTWHASQWSFLQSAVALSLRSRAEVNGEESSSEHHQEQVDSALGHLPFLPGVIVLGHQWFFVLSTREGSKTILWTKRVFGSTESIQEVYQIVAGLRELVAWARDTYLPWFREHVLQGFSATNEDQ